MFVFWASTAARATIESHCTLAIWQVQLVRICDTCLFLGFHGSQCDHRSSDACTCVVFITQIAGIMSFIFGLPRQPLRPLCHISSASTAANATIASHMLGFCGSPCDHRVTRLNLLLRQPGFQLSFHGSHCDHCVTYVGLPRQPMRPSCHIIWASL